MHTRICLSEVRLHWPGRWIVAQEKLPLTDCRWVNIPVRIELEITASWRAAADSEPVGWK